jgi:GNAT superfamily N-acetyltransferase
MTLVVRPAADGDLGRYVEVRNAVTPDWPTSRQKIEWADATYPGGVRFVTELDDRIVGAANGGRIYVYPPHHPAWWTEITVLPDARRQGAGAALLRAISGAARAAGKDALQIPVSEGRPEGIEFLAHRGFTEYERAKAVRLELQAEAPPPAAAAIPDGVRLVTLAERPDLVPGVHRVALASFGDIPGGDEPMAAGALAEFRARDVDRPGIRADGFFVAVAGEEVVGYASVQVEGGRSDVGIHDMTAVHPAWRGRGLALALKAATIEWARSVGLTALETGNDVENEPMRAVNARLGYRPLPDLLFMRGPLFD